MSIAINHGMSAGDAALVVDLLKMALQFVGGLVVAGVAVQWALGRYKQERLWDRRMQALADLLAAFGAMQRINATWLEEQQEDDHNPSRKLNHKISDERGQRYRDADWKRREVESIVTMLWPGEVANVLAELNERFEAAGVEAEQTGDYEAATGVQQTVLAETVDSLVKIGQRHSGVQNAR